MIIQELLSAIERFAAPELQEDWDNSGLLTGSAAWECTGVLCTLDVTPEVIAEALAHRCNLIVAHHPVIFRGLKKLTGKSTAEQVVIAAIRQDIALYAAHTNLDNVLLGVSGKMGERIGLKGMQVLAPRPGLLRRLITFAPLDKAGEVRQALFAAGAGHIGRYAECSFNSEGVGTFRAEEGADPYVGEVGKQHQERETKIEIVYPFYLETQVVRALVAAHPYEEVAYDIFTMDNIHYGMGPGVIGELEEALDAPAFLSLLAGRFGAHGIRHTAPGERKIKRVALCGGTGSFLLGQALKQGADAFVTADLKYHEFFDAEGKLLLADIGHYEGEQFAADLLADLLLQKFPTFAVLKSGVNTNPVQYFHS
jgi:dinuclear metal center YbgI/SA1388 family protein